MTIGIGEFADCVNVPDERFSARVADYQQFRPHYSSKIVELLKREFDFRPSWEVLDVGCGTGLSALIFLRAGCRVFGLEPNDQMRCAAEELLAPFPAFQSVAGKAEAIPLPNRSCDLVVCGESFQWIDCYIARQEFLRVLRPANRALVMWNAKQPGTSPLMDDIRNLSRAFRLPHSRPRYGDISEESYRVFFGGSHYHHFSLAFPFAVNLLQLQGLLRSYSSMPTVGDERYEEMMRAIAEVFSRHERDGSVALPFATELYFGELRLS